MNKNYNLKLDLQFRCNNSTMKFNQFDNNTSDFFMKISSGGKSFDIEKAIVVLAAIKPSGKVASQFLEIKNDIIYADLKASMRDEIGTYTAQAMLILEDERVVTDTINYEVNESKTISAFIEDAENQEEYTLLTDMLNRLSTIEVSEEQRQINEAERILAEENRKIEEAKRVEAELVRQHEEADRAKYDAIRESNENIRKQNESIRLANETNRIDEEAKRVEEENKRKLAEEERKANYDFMTEDEERRRSEANAHKEAEILRVQAETNRVNEEAKRRTTEQARVSAENTRVGNENTRKANEEARQNNEAQRVEAETQRQNRYNSFVSDAEKVANDFETYTNSAKASEEERKANELDRKSQEDRRISNEVERISNENTRKVSENARIESEKQRVDAENLRKEKIIEIQSDYDSLKKVIIDENASANLQNQINQTNSQLEHKANKVEVTSLQSQINSLVLESGGDSNLEVVQARGSYDILNDRLNKHEDDLALLVNTNSNENVWSNRTFPYTHNTTSLSGWLGYDLFGKTWLSFGDCTLLIALRITIDSMPIKFNADSITLAIKQASNVTLYNCKRLNTPTIEVGKEVTIYYSATLTTDVTSQYTDACRLYVQWGNSNNIGNPIITMHEVFVKKATSKNCVDEIALYEKYGTGGYIDLDYNDLSYTNKPAIDGITLTKDTSISEFKDGIEKVIDDKLNTTTTLLYRNYLKDFDVSTLTMNDYRVGNSSLGVNKTIENGIPRFMYTSGEGETYIYTTNISIPNYEWIAGHRYLASIQVCVNDFKTSISDSTAGNVSFSQLVASVKPFNTGSIAVSGTSSFLQNIATINADCNIVSCFTIDEDKLNNADSKNALSLQFMKISEANASLDLSIKNMVLIDMDELGVTSDNEAYTLFNKYGYATEDVKQYVYDLVAQNALHADTATIAKTVERLSVASEIEIWGDSLVAQGYGTYIAEELGRQVITKGYGGKTSTYIRDKFLSEADTNRTIIINVGRNNYQEPDVVIQDIHAMVNTIPHHNFLICCPPNGNYGEGIGTGAYDNFKLIEDRLSKQYQANFLNTREATIQEYDMGNVKLINSFTQPTIGNSVTITVSDASFLTSFNSNDASKWGEDFMNKIVIGKSIYNVDVYRIDSYGINNNTLTITLLENNSEVKPGSTVSNGVDSGGLNSIKYLRVLQYADYYCFINDITQSTFRSDGIHMTDNGRKCIAKVISRKLNTMKI